MGASIYRWPRRSTDFNLYLWLTSEECVWVGVGESLGFKPSIYVIWYYFQRTSGRVEINYRISRWYSQRKACYLVWDSYIPFGGNFIKRKKMALVTLLKRNNTWETESMSGRLGHTWKTGRMGVNSLIGEMRSGDCSRHIADRRWWLDSCNS